MKRPTIIKYPGHISFHNIKDTALFYDFVWILHWLKIIKVEP